MKPTEAGLYAARIVNPANTRKDFGLVGPSGIQYDPNKHTFTINFDAPSEEVFYCQEQKILEIYVRKAQIDKIKYGSEADPNEKIKVEQLTCVVKMPMEYIPDPRTVIEDQQDQERYEREAEERAARAEEERLIRITQEAARKEEKQKKREALLQARKEAEEGKGDDDDDSEGDGSRDSKSGSDAAGS